MLLRLLFVALITFAWSGSAFAQKAEADAAFQRGRTLMSQGKFADACASFELSMRLDPLNGTLYNLGLCHEKQGKLASAWTELKELAANDPNKKRAGDAAQRVAALAPRLTRMRLVLAEADPGVVVLRDNIDVTALVGQTSPVDPGPYTFEARTPGKPPVTVAIEIAGEGKTIEVVIPAATATIGPVVPVVAGEYPSKLPLRAIAIPDGMLEVTGATGLTDSMTHMANPIDGYVFARYGLRSFQIEAAFGLHLRYSVPMYRKGTLSVISVGARYVITPMFVAGLRYAKYQPTDDRGSSDLRALLTRKILLSPRIAVDGRAGFQFTQRDPVPSSDSGLSELTVVTEGRVQAWATAGLSFELLTNLDLNIGGALYENATSLQVTGLVNYALGQLDVFLQAGRVLLPSGDFSSVGLGATWRSR